MWLTPEEFEQVVRHAPLVSIDLIVRNDRGEMLLGLRENEPAAGTWFVPGGRIHKDDHDLDAAFARVAREELGVEVARRDARLLDVFTHRYETNTFRKPGFGTLYVVLAFELSATPDLATLPGGQHRRYAWVAPADARDRDDVHRYTRDYCSILCNPDASTPFSAP
jgi:colanic acid biosynthesis protein WcaH